MLDKILEIARADAWGDVRTLAPELDDLAGTAPAPVGELIRLLGTRQVRVPLGWRSIETR